MSSSFSAEADFGIASLVLPSTSHQLVICDFCAVGPGMGEYSIWRRVIGSEGGQFEVVIRAVCQQTDHDAYIFSEVRKAQNGPIVL